MSLLCHRLIELRLLASAVQCSVTQLVVLFISSYELVCSTPHFTLCVGCDPNPISNTEEIHLSTLIELFVVGEYVL